MRTLYGDKLIGSEFLNVPLGVKQRCGVDWKPTKDQIGDSYMRFSRERDTQGVLSPSFNDSRTALSRIRGTVTA